MVRLPSPLAGMSENHQGPLPELFECVASKIQHAARRSRQGIFVRRSSSSSSSYS